ncbi:MAG: glycoside hydrolase family 3 C-terminal domain-containing protein [Clostridia bacterium]|nr:glycoside hydrolase family 3 C-terminal domain-containing protein [Clostridia bacterium]
MDKYVEILNSLTLEEKASLCSGKTFWLTKEIEDKVPSVWMSDGPHGLRKEKASAGTNIMRPAETATCFPTAVTTGSSWDVELLEEVGNAIAEEAKCLGVTTVLGPGINMKRSPLCGRNFEYIAEDPFLAGRLGASYVHGVQKNGIGVSVKHFCANNQEHDRMSIDTIVDERALREIYLSAFEYIVKKEQPKTIMSSYNRVNGTYMAENKRLLTDVLRGEWGFEGMVVSDWGGINDRVEGVKAGNDLEMPGNGGMNDRKIVKAVKAGELSMEDLDKVVLRLIKFAIEAKPNESTGDIDFAKHHALARKAAANGAVLLKNDGGLPLSGNENIAVIGTLAKELRYQGAGSSHINCPKTVSFTDALDEAGKKYTYSAGYSLKGDGYNEKLINKAVEASKGKDAVLVFVGLTAAYESEGFDRRHMEMPSSHVTLINEILKVNQNVIVIISGGSPVVIGDWADKVKSILNMYLTGQAGGEATLDLVYGAVNPSGKLAETYPIANEDALSSAYYQMGPRSVEHRESIYIGYRYFDTAGKDVRYPFGYGLSYTNFEYSDIKLSASAINEGEDLVVSFKIKNVGERDGAEVAQVYVSAPESKIYKAQKELKGFAKVFLKAGEEKEVNITLDSRAYAYYNVNINDWHVESGAYKILVGASSRDIKLESEVNVTGAKADVEVPDYSAVAPVYYNLATATEVKEEEFQAVYGKELPGNAPFEKGSFTINNTISQLRPSAFGNGMYLLLTNAAKLVAIGAENPEMITQSVKDLPLRAFSGWTGGIVSPYTVEGILDCCNGVKGGLGKIFRGFLPKNR